MNGVDPKVQERIQLWKPLERDPLPDWYVWSGYWHECNFEKTAYIAWDVGPESIVFDVGGYRGEWSRRMVAKYDPILHLFEPAPRAFTFARHCLRGNPKAHAHNFGLSSTSDMVQLGDADRDGARVGTDELPVVTVQMRAFSEFLDEVGIESIDLMSMNIEGGEYDLLDHMISTGTLLLVHQVMIQWHWRGEGDGDRQYALQEHIASTHRMMWNYGAWEAWEKRVE